MTVNNDDGDFTMTLPAGNAAEYVGVLSGDRVKNENGQIRVNMKGNSGEIWLPAELAGKAVDSEKPGAAFAESRPAQTELPAENKTEPEKDAMEEISAAEEEKAEAEEAPATEEEKAVAEEASEAEEEKDVAEEASEAEEEKAVVEEVSAVKEEKVVPENPPHQKSYEEMSIEELQEAILERMRRNGPVTDRMRQDVIENVYHNSLLNWIRSFR